MTDTVMNKIACITATFIKLLPHSMKFGFIRRKEI